MRKVRLVNNAPPKEVTERDLLAGVEKQALSPIGGKWADKEHVELRIGGQYTFQGRTYTHLGLLRRDDVRNFIYGDDILGGKTVKLTADQAKEKYVLPQTPWNLQNAAPYSGFENPRFLYAFRSGESFLIASTSRGMRPIEAVEKGVPALAGNAREVTSKSPFQQHMTPDAMNETAKNLGLNVGDAVLLVEPVDPHFPLALALSKLRVAAVSMNMEIPPEEKQKDSPIEDTRDRTHIEILASDFEPKIIEAGGAILTAHPIQLVDATPGQFSAAAVNGLDDLPPDVAKALATVVLKAMSPNSRLMVTKKDPARTETAIFGAAADAGVTLQKIKDGILFDVPEEATLYEMTAKRAQKQSP